MIKNKIKMSKAEERACQYTGYCRNQSYSDFLNGYRQAEEDLSDISWIKEVSGVKDMSRAKEEALKAYPPRSIAANYDTINRRDAFEYGYLKSEKDLELTVDDIMKLDALLIEMWNRPSNEDKYQEVLKRFKERKDGSKR